MSALPVIEIVAIDHDQIAHETGRVVVLVPGTGKLDQQARWVDALTKGALERCVESEAFSKLKPGKALDLNFPSGMQAEAVQVVRLDHKAKAADIRKAGVAIGRAALGKDVLVLCEGLRNIGELALGAGMRAYQYRKVTSEVPESAETKLRFETSQTEAAEAQIAEAHAAIAGVHLVRDLVSAPSNILNTQSFADQLEALADTGLTVKVMEADALEELGMGAFLSVGRGSVNPTKLVALEWNGGGKEKPLALVGKGVVFDTGGISLKPAGGMEEMTMDMGGAATVAGVMKTLALRGAKANVVGLVGLVENMPDAKATRPGDVVTSMKGDTVEVINTDAEGRLVLCDVMWYAQETYQPRAMVDLATLTGAIIVALGHTEAGVFSNNDAFCDAFLKAAAEEGEAAWRMPIGAHFHKALKSTVADVKNVGGRPGGASIAAAFLERFVKPDVPWIHLDIAGVAKIKTEGPASPSGATGWGVLALNRLIREGYET